MKKISNSHITIEIKIEYPAYAPNVARSAMAPDTIVVDVAANAQWKSQEAYPFALNMPVVVPNSSSPLRAKPLTPMKPDQSLPNANPWPISHHARPPSTESPMFYRCYCWE